ncbi:MAG: 1-deoxy-D-xylulose-5-phosphate synthase [Clostridia bacterium]|nr:1-deoxy-D-xylulose-5-phosphate synthase [Clostridia bacterium]
MILDKVNYPEDLKKLNLEEKQILAQEIRDKIINTVSNTGGHLASNLGVVELTMAIHSVFNCPKDKIIWDVGHQTYVHKILTGRKDKLDTLRQLDGMAGFPKTSESEYDSYDTGHSSTSISVALGMARARDIKGENHKIITVIGDGALTGGMALEALNDAGSSLSNIIVILNDNEMSISKNVGGISMVLSKLRTKGFYVKSNLKGKKIINKVPFVGKKIIKLVQRAKRGIKQLVIPKMYFEDIGFRYLGPVDGHNIEKLEDILKICKEQEGPLLVHVLTKKGKGYKPAEENPDVFHSTSKFEIETGKKIGAGKKDYSKTMGDKLVELAKDNKKIVAITAAMADGTGLAEFAKKFPDRFFDVGIAEQHAIGLAGGLAKEGLVPVVPIYSSFLQRAYDQIVHDICIQNLPVVIIADRAGIVGNDGETHQGLLDMSFGNTIPNLNIMAPKDFKELENMLEFAINLGKPVLIRYPRGSEEMAFEQQENINYGKAEILKAGNEVCLIAIGKMVSRAYKVAERLEEKDISAKVINVRFLKPIDEEFLKQQIKACSIVATIEDGTIKGGLASEVERIITQNKMKNVEFIGFAYQDEFVKHGKTEEIEKRHNLDVEGITNTILDSKSLKLRLSIKEIKNRGQKCLKMIENNIKVKKSQIK